MPLDNKKTHILTIMFAASGFALESLAIDKSMMLVKQQNLSQMKSSVIAEELGLYAEIWTPQSVKDIREYFNYHKDFEVLNLMREFNKLLGFGIPDKVIVSRSYRHDLPKVESFHNLEKQGYKGWPRSIATPFLSAVLGISEAEVERGLGTQGEYLKIDLATRLLFSFGISKANYMKLFKTKEAQRAVFAELVDLPNTINKIEKSIKSSDGWSDQYKINSKQLAQLNLIENLADFVSRTQNLLARVEYSKIFKQSSAFMSEDIRRRKNDPRYKYSFVTEKIIEESGARFIQELGLEKILEVLLTVEAEYPRIIKTARENKNSHFRIKTFRNSNEKLERVDFVKLNWSLRTASLQRACKELFKKK